MLYRHNLVVGESEIDTQYYTTGLRQLLILLEFTISSEIEDPSSFRSSEYEGVFAGNWDEAQSQLPAARMRVSHELYLLSTF